MANCNPPVKGQAFDLSASLYTTAGALITNPGTLTLKISKDFGDWGDAAGAGASEEDSTYGQVKIALNATDMNADVVDVYLKDDTSGCVAYKATIYTCSATRGLAGTALPDAAADAVGGLPISDAGGLDLDTLLGHLDEDVSAAKTLTGDYDAAKTAAQAGDEMDLVDAPNSTALGAIKDAVQGAGTTLATLLSRIVGTLATGTHNPQSGDAYARIGANGASLTALGDTRLANLDAAVSTREAAGAAAAAVGGLHDFDPTTDEVDVGAVKGVAVTSIDDFKADVSGLSTLTVGDLPSEPPSAATVASQVRTELTTELGRIDAAVTTRLATSGYTAPPSAASVATAVWGAVERTLTAFGFAIEATVDEEALAAAIVAAIGDEGLVDETALANAVVAALGALTVTITSPVAADGTITIYQESDYYATEGRSIPVEIEDPLHRYKLDAEDAVVQLRLPKATFLATSRVETDEGYTCHFEPTSEQTAALTAGGDAQVWGIMANGRQYPLRSVRATLVRAVAEAVVEEST